MTRKPSPIPDFDVKVVQPAGDMHPDWYRFFTNFVASLGGAIDVIDTPVPDPEFELVEEFSVFIAFPANKDYRLQLKATVARAITEVVTRSGGGTCTATLKVDTTALGGSANSVSSTEQSQVHATSNTWGVGQDVVLTISANSSCVDLSLTFKTTRTIVV